MRRSTYISITVVLILSVVAAGCSLINPPSVTQAEINEDLAELQAMIPVLESGLAIGVAPEFTLATASAAGRASAQTINAGVVWPVPVPKPSEIYSDGTADASDWVRYPYDSATYLEDFYGTPGNRAEFYITPHASVASGYQVKLYIYPTFSTSVNYILEEYIVLDNTTWALVDDTGTLDPLYYITNRTVYFDGTVEEHEVLANSADTVTYYDTLFDESLDNDPSTDVYDFPANPMNADPATISDPSISYSAKVVSTIAATGITVVEYYTEIDDGSGNITKTAVSYVTKAYISGQFDEDATTVRKYVEYPDGTKAVRARTESVTSFGGAASDPKTITETVDIAVDADGLVTFTSVTSATASASSGTSPLYTSSVALTEDSATSDSFSGTSTYEQSAGTTNVYTVTLTNGGQMTISGDTTSVYTPITQQAAKDIIADLRHGTFTGELRGSTLAGLYKALRSDDPATVEAALSYIYAITGTEVQLQ